MKKLQIGLVLVFATSCSMAMAKKPFMDLFYTTYQIKPDSTIAKAKCQLCHTKTFKMNPYGADLKAELTKEGLKVVTVDVLKAVEPLDSDKDGFSNIDEIKADTLPGDPTSFPPKK